MFMYRTRFFDSGILESTSLIAPLVNKSNSDSTDTSLKPFSAFPLTSRVPAPVLRLVARHPFHSLSLAFLRIPEIDDGFEWTVFFGKDAVVEDVINNVVQELGLLKALPSSRGGGQIEYALEVLSGNQGAQFFLILDGLTILTLMISYTTVRVHALGRHSEVFRASTCHPVLHSGPMVPSKTALLFYPIAFYDRQLCGRGGGRYRKAEQV